MTNTVLPAQPFLRVNVPNLNGVLYPKEVIEKALKEFQESGRHLMGELKMPKSAVIDDEVYHPGLSVRLDHASHRVDNVRLEGNLLVGDVTIMKTPAGKILEDWNHQHVQFGARGLAMYRTAVEGQPMTVEDFKLIACDVVQERAF